jgi:AAA domain, putative AbiEii toxin, Type IV TA system
VLSSDFSGLREEEFALECEIAVEGGEIILALRNEQTTGASRPEAVYGLRPPEAPSYRSSADLHLRLREPVVESRLHADPSGVVLEATGNTPRAEAVPLDILQSPLTLLLVSLAQLGGAPREWVWRVSPDISRSRSICRFDEALEVFRLISSSRSPHPTHPGTAEKAPLMTFIPGDMRSDTPPGISRITLTSPGSLLPSSIRDYTFQTCVARIHSGMPLDGFSIGDKALAFLKDVTSTLGFRSAELNLRLLEKRVSGGSESFDFGDFRFTFERRDGSRISHERLSYGQKRLLAFFYYLEANPYTVIADELVDGLHHRWIEECIAAMASRQCFLASQNPLLFDYLEFASAEEVQKGFILCRLEADGDRERMVWSNMTDYDAERFFEAYQVGLQHVSEILRTKGLW